MTCQDVLIQITGSFLGALAAIVVVAAFLLLSKCPCGKGARVWRCLRDRAPSIEDQLQDMLREARERKEEDRARRAAP
jgi:hypothetical protein